MTDAASAVGWAGTAAALGLFASPVRDVYGKNGIRGLRSTSRLATGLPYYATTFNCVYWVAYLAPQASDFVPALTVNLIGSVLNGSFAFVYYAHCTEQERRLCKRWLALGFGFLACLVIASLVFDDVEVIGYGAAVMNVCMYYAPLAAVGTVVRSRSVEKMPFLPLAMAFVSGTLWTAYGFLVDKIPIILPNLIGVCLAVIQIVIWTYFYANGRPRTQNPIVLAELDPVTPTAAGDDYVGSPDVALDLQGSPFVNDDQDQVGFEGGDDVERERRESAVVEPLEV